MRLIPPLVVILQLAGATAQAQTYGDLQIELGAYELRDDGGEKPLGVWRSTGPVAIGKTIGSTFSFGDSCEAWAVSSAGELREDATTAWRIELTPVRVVRDAVTFRLRWVRFAALRQQLDQIPLDDGKAFRLPNEDVELTLRPGESRPVDSVQVPAGAKTVHGRPCGRLASIRVLVDTYPWEQDDRRLVAADLWLIERLAGGGEAQRGQPLSVRGLPNRPLPFYFDSIVEANVPLDIFGALIVRPESGAIGLSLDTRCRWGRSDSRFMGPQRSVQSDVQVRPAETVDIRLPALGEDAGPFGKREFAVRIRARQLR